MSFDSESHPQAIPLMDLESKSREVVAVSEEADANTIRTTASAKKTDLQHNYQIIAVVSTLLAAVASTLLTPLGNEANYKRYSSTVNPNSVPLSDLSDRLLAACYTSLILSIEATCLTCYLKYRLSTLTDHEICRVWKHKHVKVDTSKRCFANYEIRALSLIFWFCFVSAILLMLGVILVYMYWQLPPVWFYIWSAWSALLFFIFLPLLTLRLYRTITGTDFTY